MIRILIADDFKLLREVIRIGDHTGHDQPRAVFGQREAVEEFLDDGAAAVGHTVRPQIAWREIGRHHF